ncbi:hypothetical protein BC938DRAFT_474871 [Jimgerdemannia flammicorona]|uniref:Uncharacterized protein n=1 Tax=Jimgerdemannia flammicorona TaxID=994334 RepID=A0A433Q1D7_9FUNG|nr:hypothetical protein BC938DRAFT_474871 [Jimgerdemannia flammicorona]
MRDMQAVDGVRAGHGGTTRQNCTLLMGDIYIKMEVCQVGEEFGFWGLPRYTVWMKYTMPMPIKKANLEVVGIRDETEEELGSLREGLKFVPEGARS